MEYVRALHSVYLKRFFFNNYVMYVYIKFHLGGGSYVSDKLALLCVGGVIARLKGRTAACYTSGMYSSNSGLCVM